MRRVPKPFTVEVRTQGRIKSRSPSLAALALKLEAEQPHVTAWPSIGRQPEAPPISEPSATAIMPPVGRVLPDLDQIARAEALAKIAASSKPKRLRTPIAGSSELDESEELAPIVGIEQPELGPAAQPEVTASRPPSRRLRRLPRQAFKRGDRWKARLPAAVQRTGLARLAPSIGEPT